MEIETMSEQVATVDGITMAKVNPKIVQIAIGKLGIKVPGTATLARKVQLLSEHFGADGDLVECDNCGGISSPDLEACPFCGVGETTEDSAEAANDAELETKAEEEAEADDAPAEPETEISDPATMLATSATYEEEKPTQGKGRKPRGPGSVARALARLDGVDIQTSDTVDAAVERVKLLVREDKMNGHRLGKALWDIHSTELWKLRKTKDGQVAYKTWDQFLGAEVSEITTRYAWMLMQVANAYTESEFAELGPKKLYATLAIDQEDIRKQLLAKAKEGATVEELIGEARKVREATGAKRHPKDHSKTQKQKTGAKAGKTTDATKITVATVLGKKTVALYCKGNDSKVAKKIEDQPWGTFDLVNDVRVHFAVVRTPSGALKLNINIKRVEE